MRVQGRRVRRRGDDGAAAVEFALVVPLLLLLILGIISYGYMLSFRQALSQGAAEGARAAAITPSGLDDDERELRALAKVDEALASYGASCDDAGVTCTVTFSDCGDARCASVLVAYPYEDGDVGPKFPGSGVVLPDSLTYTSVVEVS
jgi:Flp pilus assembly protein TadG